MAEPAQVDEVVQWQTYPSWRLFTWLYFFSLVTALRGGLFLWFGVSGGEAWLSGAGMLLVCAALLRRWEKCILTSCRVIVRNGYTGREIQAITLDDIREVTIKQGPIARVLRIGTVVIQSSRGDRLMTLRGINDPEIIKSRIQALRPNRVTAQQAARL